MRCFLMWCLGGLLVLTPARGTVTVVVPPAAGPRVQLAARELRRYVYLRTGELPALAPALPPDGDALVLSVAPGETGPDTYRITTTATGPRRLTTIAGADDGGALFGAYRWCERLGVRFYLHGDVVPDARWTGPLPDVNETGRPLFELRGIQPFHDFPEGPDWWTQDDWLAYVGQLPKLRMNFIGLHCYPEGGVGPEPSVWIGLPGDVGTNGAVSFAYPSEWASTSRRTMWGYAPMKTSTFSGGAAQLFATDEFGHESLSDLLPLSATPAAMSETFQRTGRMWGEVFGFARRLGVKTCLGTETPLTIPKAVQERLKAQGRDPKDPAVVRELYEGMFRRIQATHPLDYYWLWTPEDWTWHGNSTDQYAAVTRDISLAHDALKTLGQPFQLATCGWVLGPLGDRSALDRDLPKSVPVSCINREVGHDGVEPGFAQVKGRGKWAIPWMENDPNLVSPQPFVGRMRYDAADALRLGCTGLLGIHWRTKALAGNVSALAAAAWDQSWKPTNWQVTLPAPVVPVSQEKGPIGGKTAAFSQVMADTTNQPVYQTVRFDLDGYEWNVTNGDYTVTLQFVEPAYKQAGKRVFGVQLQGTNVVTRLDVFERVGANRALDLVFPGIAVRDGKLRLDFVRQVEFPAIAGVVIERTSPGAPWTRRINCGGPAWGAYETDKVVAPKTPDVVRRRAMPVAAFYEDFARAHFGDEVGAAAGAVLSRIDGLNLPETTAWLGGPGGIPVRGWPEGTFAFVNELEAMRDRVQGAGNRERFDYWLNTYRFQRDIAAVSGLRARLDDAMKSLPPQTTNALALRMQLARAWETMVSRQVSLTDTPGELGTLANLEQHTRGNNHFLTHHDAALAKALGRSLPAEAEPRGAYTGPPRLVVPTVRTQAAPGEALTLPVFAVDQTPLTGVTLHWRALGRGEWSRVAAQSLGRAVYRVVLPGSAEDVEYYLTARTASGTELTWPPTAPALPQTVVRLR